MCDGAIRFLERATSSVTRLTDAVGAGVMALLMFITAVDVILRYIFNRPIPGSIELTELMMAVVVALALAYTAVRRGHISVDLVIVRLSPRVQAGINSITCLLSLAIFALITRQSIVYAENARLGHQISPVWYLPVYPFIYIVALGSFIICLVLLADLLKYLKAATGVRWWASAGLALAALLAVLLFTAPFWGRGLLWQVSPVTAGLIGTGILIVALFSGMTLGTVMVLIGFWGMAYISSLSAGLSIMATVPYTTSASHEYSVFPLFVLMGAFCFYSGLSEGLYYSAYKWLGRLPGGLAMATIWGCAGFAAVCGSSLATASTMCTVALPEMKRYKYDSALATGCIAGGGTIGILIPPSVIMVIYGILTEQSIGKLFLAGFIPGILQAVLFMITIYILCRRNPLLGPQGASASLKEKVASLKDTWGVLVLFLLVLGGIYIGIFTPTEAAGVGAFGAFIFALGKRRLGWKHFKASLFETVETTGMGFLILIGGMVFGYFLSVSRLPFDMGTVVAGLGVNRYIILTGIILIYVLLGCIMSALAMIIITVPIFYPVITALGFDPIWFGIIIVMMVEIGQITPPVGVNVFIIQGMAKDIPMYTIFRGIVPFLIATLLEVVLLVIVPEVALILPNMMK